MSEQCLGHIATGRRHQLNGGKLDRLVVVHPAGQAIPDANLNRRGDRSDRERDDEAEIVVAVAPTAQHPGGMNRSDQESAYQVRGDHHMCRLHGMESLKITWTGRP